MKSNFSNLPHLVLKLDFGCVVTRRFIYERVITRLLSIGYKWIGGQSELMFAQDDNLHINLNSYGYDGGISRDTRQFSKRDFTNNRTILQFSADTQLQEFLDAADLLWKDAHKPLEIQRNLNGCLCTITHEQIHIDATEVISKTRIMAEAVRQNELARRNL